MTLRELKALDVGSEVYYEDAENGVASGHYMVSKVLTETGLVEEADSVLVLSNGPGGEIEVFAYELR